MNKIQGNNILWTSQFARLLQSILLSSSNSITLIKHQLEYTTSQSSVFQSKLLMPALTNQLFAMFTRNEEDHKICAQCGVHGHNRLSCSWKFSTRCGITVDQVKVTFAKQFFAWCPWCWDIRQRTVLQRWLLPDLFDSKPLNQLRLFFWLKKCHKRLEIFGAGKNDFLECQKSQNLRERRLEIAFNLL